MAKNAKKGTTTQGKAITDFFTFAGKPPPQPSKSRVSPSMPASSSQVIRPTILNKSKVASIVSKPPIESLSKAPSLDDLGSSSSTKTRPLSSLKRGRSPDFQTRATTPLNKKVISDSKTDDRRKSKFDSDSDIEIPNTVIYVNSMVCQSLIPWCTYFDILQSNLKSRKKVRLSPPEDFSRVGSLVPSSQSDEENLVSVKEQAHLPTLTLENNESMEVNANNDFISEFTTKATSPNCQMLTPPLTDHSFPAPTPILLDPATKTAQIIAQIKERAYAKIHSSPEVAPLEFNDDLDDSSDDDSFLPVLPFVTKPARYDIDIIYL